MGTPAATALRVAPEGPHVEVHVRSARLTDVDAATSLLVRETDDEVGRRANADRLRTLLFVPAATVLVAEAGREVVGVGVLSIRPSVRSGPFVGIVDELSAAAAGGSAPRGAGAAQRSAIASSILEQLVASARNKGCARVDVADPLAAAQRALLQRAGFARQGALLSRAIG